MERYVLGGGVKVIGREGGIVDGRDIQSDNGRVCFACAGGIAQHGICNLTGGKGLVVNSHIIYQAIEGICALAGTNGESPIALIIGGGSVRSDHHPIAVNKPLLGGGIKNAGPVVPL